jgi:hypothetical protein
MKKKVVFTEKPKRLIADIPPGMHHAVKTRALKKKLTIREWILLAITDRISREMIEEI